MAVAFAPSTDLSREDLNIFLQNAAGNPANAYEITYAIYFVDPNPPEAEVLIGSATRTPENPAVGEYYASFRVPAGATVGNYRIRWTFRELAGSPLQMVVQEFAVVATGSVLVANTYSAAEQDLIRRLRIWLRDNCIDGAEQITVRAGIKEQHISLAALYVAVQDAAPKSPLKTAYHEGRLQTRSLSPEGRWKWKAIERVVKVSAPLERLVQVQTDHGIARMTAGHRVFTSPVEKIEALGLTRHQRVAGGREIINVTDCGTADEVYDITVADWHNFQLDRSGLVVSNCPDRNYRFQPPEHESTIGSYNQVFGYIWEDAELYEYLQSALDYFNMFPPETEDLSSLNTMIEKKKAWASAVLYGSVSIAAMALMANWVVNGVSYSIGGISLDLNKSSEYQSLKDAADQMFDKATTAKQQTVFIIRGLKQPRFAAGVSTVGPNVGRGITMHPRNFMGAS